MFHTLFWPAILMGYDEKLTLPYDVPATQYLNFSGEKMSAGRGLGVWLSDLLERFDPDQLRYYGIATMPEIKDTDFEWEDFERRNNTELLAIYGNFVHRALTFAGATLPPWARSRRASAVLVGVVGVFLVLRGLASWGVVPHPRLW